MIETRRLFRSFKDAFRGLVYAIKKEQNLKIELIAAVLVIVAMLVAGVERWEAVVLIFAIIAVLILEVLNTVLERIMNIFKPRIHPQIKVLKDLMAAAVFLTSIAATIIGIIIFIPYFF